MLESWYNIRYFSFLFKLTRKHLSDVKQQVGGVVGRLSEGDKAYLQHPDRPLRLLEIGSEVVEIMKYKTPVEFSVKEGLKECVFILQEFPYAQKHVLVIVDRYDPKWAYGLKMGLKFDLINEFNCNFSLIGIGDQYDKSLLQEACQYHPRCVYVHFDTPSDELGQYIWNTYEKMGEAWRKTN